MPQDSDSTHDPDSNSEHGTDPIEHAANPDQSDHDAPYALDALAAAAESADDAQVQLDHRCPSCGSHRSKPGVAIAGVAGRVGFLPHGKTKAVGYPVRAAVCLDCGHLRHYLAANDVKAIGDG